MKDKVKPLVSIITVVYNGVNTLEQTILSVKGQTYNNVEYIIIDGGSTDGTIELIKKYESQISFWISEKDKGLYDAMNKGINISKGELIGIINSDDWYEPNAVEIVVQNYLSNPRKRIFHGDRFNIDELNTKSLRRFSSSYLKFVLYGMTYNHPSMFVHREIYQKERYNVDLKYLSDYEFVLKNYLRDRKIFLYIPLSYVNYRTFGASSKMSFSIAIREGYVIRKNAKVNLFINIFSVIVRGTKLISDKIKHVL